MVSKDGQDLVLPPKEAPSPEKKIHPKQVVQLQDDSCERQVSDLSKDDECRGGSL